MTYPEETTLQQKFLQDKSREFQFTGDTHQIFIVRFDPNNSAIDDDEQLANKITFKNQIDVPDQKIKDELKNNIYPILKKNGCLIESKPGRPQKGNEPWKQAYKWLWEQKYPEWLAQQQIQNNQPEPQPETPQINWREVCQKMLQKQQHQQRLRRQITELKHEIEIFVQLGLIQPKPARRKEKTPFPDADEGMQQYKLEPEEITKQYEYQQFIDEVIGQQTKNLAIIGEPGAGKTTWLSKIAEELTDNPKYPSPICISLSRLDNRTLEDYLLHTWLVEALEFIPSQITPALVADFQQQFKDKRVWLLLDGVDEMKTTANSPLSQLNSLLEGWVTWTRVILTCRLNVWQPNPIANFEYYRTLAFSDVQVGNFIQQWYEKAEKPELGKQLQQKLTAPQHSRIFDLVKNPLRLAMLCQSWYFLQGELPETKANLYQRFVNATYEWKQGEFGTTAEQRQQLNQALGNLALRMIDKQISLKESVINDVMSPEEFELAERLGWLNWVYCEQKTDERVYAFFHLSFAEYFAACVIDDWDYFLPKNHVDKPVDGKKYRIFENEWNEIFLLWMGRGDIDDKKEEFIQVLVNFESGSAFNGGFYFFQACFKAGTAIAEFKNCSLADEIVDTVIKLKFGYFNNEKQEWVTFPDPIPKDAGKILSLTDIQKVIPALISILHHTQSVYTCFSIAEILGKIAVGNEQAIAALISLLNTTQNELTRGSIAEILGKIAVGNEQAIATLISLLNTTQNELTRRSVADSLGKIDVGNEQAIAALIFLLQDELIRKEVADSLGKIAVGNEQAIASLISLLNTTQDEDIRSSIANILEKIAVRNEQAIATLISLLNTTQNEDTRRSVAYSLGDIAVGNKGAITALISLLNTTQNEDTRRSVADSLGKIAVGNEQAIATLISLLNTTQNEDTRRSVADSLGKIAVGNEQAIATLISLLNTTQDEDIRLIVAASLGKIDVGNEQAISALISLLHTTQDEDIRLIVAASLGKIDVGNEQAISALISLLHTTQDLCKDLYNRLIVTNILGEIAIGNEGAINALISLLDSTHDENIGGSVANILGKIAAGNEGAITALISLLQHTQNKYDREKIAERLEKILKTENNYLMTVSALNKYLINEVYENNPDLCKNYYKILSQCATKLTYPQFYQAWHATPTYHPEMADYQPSTDTTTLNQLEQQYTDIYTQLKQLQPTSTTYPIPLNAANLEGKTAEKAIAKGILIKIYGEIYPKQKAKTIEDIFDLENQLQPVRKHLNTDKIALIFCHINPHPELIKFCQQLQNDWLKIALITDTPIASPLSGFPPQQDNLLGVVQTWLEELG
ncbi:hypothetical protein BMF77_04358 [Dolichospermum sp. UHCC 0315A]|uniref:HEAT repeat domain-containing protein n=1 Tax=Dolichospermum sp. UHCC 0315A TaxID=1914871 RepID=UPI0011E73478|nr:HEAT repeat domain-containing protein [Dolichospermum sp. UHCC 0315A]QEI43737.1 hypothetical protein BMF77_04358 [Dolichospermum sp. UHCC 0315A]